MFADNNEIEWATPVLYLRSKDGRIFARRRGPQPDRLAREEADRREADRLAREEADRREADRLAREEADRREADRLAAERLGRGETRTLGGEQLSTGELARAGPKRPAAGPRPWVPILAFGPLILGLPLLILAVKVLAPSYVFTKPWALAVLCSAILGGVVAAVEHQRHRVPVWTAALEFFFAWFLIYALYKLNVGHIRRIGAHVPPLVILAGVGAVVSAVLCQRALARWLKKGGGVHPLLPAFLICMVVGLGAAAIRYASMHYSAVLILQRIGPSSSHIGGVFLFAALVTDLLAPLLALMRKLNGR